MFKIGEFSKLTQVSVRMLRYYDAIGLLKPAQVDRSTGYRLYSVEQIPTLQKIILLRDLKFKLSEIMGTLANWEEQYIIQQLENRKTEIQNQIQREQQRMGKIEMAINDIKAAKSEIHYNVAFKSIPSYKIVSLRKIIPNYHCEGTLWAQLFGFIKRERIEIIHHSHNNLAIYHDQEHKDSDVDVEVGMMVNQLGQNKDEFTFRQTEPVNTMACMMVYGSYQNIGPAYQSFAGWLANHPQYKMTGLSRQVCHRGPNNETNPNNYLTEIQNPVIQI